MPALQPFLLPEEHMVTFLAGHYFLICCPLLFSKKKIKKDFYETLYSSQINLSDAEIEEILNNINFPQLNDEQIVALDSPLSSSKFHEALQHLPKYKAPAPDGFPAVFHKEFWSMLEPSAANFF